MHYSCIRMATVGVKGLTLVCWSGRLWQAHRTLMSVSAPCELHISGRPLRDMMSAATFASLWRGSRWSAVIRGDAYCMYSIFIPLYHVV